jgi:hypothetical protein
MALGLLVFVSGCMVSHSDTLVFGTNTKLAVDLSLNSTTNVPSLTVGYTRQEGVWMPLYVNARDSRFSNSSSSSVFKNFTSNMSGLKYAGNQGGDRDTYSVLASFGADIKNGSGGAGVGIAQYFATGIAARELANQGGAKLVSLQAEGQISEEIKQAAAKQLTQWNYKADLLTAYVNEGGKVSETKLNSIIKGTGLDSGFVNQFKNQPVNNFKSALQSPLYLGNVDALAANIPN